MPLRPGSPGAGGKTRGRIAVTLVALDTVDVDAVEDIGCQQLGRIGRDVVVEHDKVGEKTGIEVAQARLRVGRQRAYAYTTTNLSCRVITQHHTHR